MNIVYGNLEAAQRLSGAFTLGDCKNLNVAADALLAYFNNTSTEKVAKQEEYDHLSVLINCCVLQQKTGKFSLEGSQMLLENKQIII